MPYRLIYHPAVAKTDLPSIPANLRDRIARAIESRLTSDPRPYGSPLRGTLVGCWKLRVGDYRVVYRIVMQDVRILAVRHRRDVYSEAPRRE